MMGGGGGSFFKSSMQCNMQITSFNQVKFLIKGNFGHDAGIIIIIIRHKCITSLVSYPLLEGSLILIFQKFICAGV